MDSFTIAVIAGDALVLIVFLAMLVVDKKDKKDKMDKMDKMGKKKDNLVNPVGKRPI